ncbi:MAG: PaaI family thioesterase [Woeseiaceae bacterium]|nr:PaaI family thioesterase [Woeseiaceae bacterium]
MNDEAPSSILDNPALCEGTYLEFLGFKLVDWKDGYAQLEMPVRSDHRNTVGFLHGGVISSLLDIAGAVAGSYGDAQESVSITVNLNVNFMAPQQGSVAVAEGELVRTTTSLFFAQSRLLDARNNRLCATATGTYKKKPRE